MVGIERGIKIEVPDFNVHHHIHAPPVQWEPILLIAVVVGLLFSIRRKS